MAWVGGTEATNRRCAPSRNATGATEWLEVLFSIVIAASFSVMSPFPGCNMHIVAPEDFQRNAIFSLDMLEMRLSS